MVSSGDHLITSTIEHHAVLNACRHLEKQGCDVTYIPVDGRGLVDPADVKRAIRPNTKLISIMSANNETGVVQPVAEIGKIAAEADIYFHTDAVQAAGKIRSDVNEIGCDLLSISATSFTDRRVWRALHQEGNSARAYALWRRSWRFAARSNRERSGSCRVGEGSRLGPPWLRTVRDRKMAAVRDHWKGNCSRSKAPI